MSHASRSSLWFRQMRAAFALATLPWSAAGAMDFGAAQWIWAPAAPGRPATEQAAGEVWFRAGVAVSEKARIKNAELLVTADNLYTVYLNGRLVGESSDDPNAWNRPKRFDVASMLVAGHNVVAVEAVNTAAGPAGLLLRLAVTLEDGQVAGLVSDASWKQAVDEPANWQQPVLDDQAWPSAVCVAALGAPPWGNLNPNVPLETAGGPADSGLTTAGAPLPGAVVFVGGDCSLYRPAGGRGNSYDSLSVTIFNPRDSRAFPEHDLPSPMKVGRRLMVIEPSTAGALPRVLCDAGDGALGSPSVSFDGRWIYFSMVPAGEAFYHIYRIEAGGGKAQRLTNGPFHDIDPCELPDGRLVFTSTRIGTFEEYHNPPSRALFTMDADGRQIQPLTHTIVFDNEPEVLADGRILFIRSDNFFGRGKVETLLHAIYPDGSSGQTEFGLDLGPEYGNRLRAFHCGSPAPMPDGRVAFLTAAGIAVGLPGCRNEELQHLPVAAGDVAAMPDGRLLCTLPGRDRGAAKVQAGMRPATSYTKIAVVDPAGPAARPALVHDSKDGAIHSPVYLGERPRPPRLTSKINRARAAEPQPTGVLVCQNVRNTRNTSAGWPHVRAVRVLAGAGLTMRSSHSYIVHAGSDVTELGTVPLAADGSFAVEVPADTPIAFQAVDGEGRSELNEMSWIFVRPGETRSCVGCHQSRQTAPSASLQQVQALRVAPLKLLGKGRPLRFRGNNAAVTGLMEMQFDRYREVAGINRHSETRDPAATGSDEVREWIQHLGDASPDLRVSAAQRLAVFRRAEAAPALTKLLGDPAREVRVAAAISLAACGTGDSIASLLDAMLDEDPWVARAAAVAAENLTATALPFDPLDETRTRREQVEAWRKQLQSWGSGGLDRELARRIAGSDRDAVRRAAVAAGHLGGAAGRAALIDYVRAERDRNPYPAWLPGHRGDGARFNAASPANPRTLQAAVRALGRPGDQDVAPMLIETLQLAIQPGRENLFLAEAAAEALGRTGTPEALAALVETFGKLPAYPNYNRWYGDHDALIACHASPVHGWILEALDAHATANITPVLAKLIESVPTDTDRALFPNNDDYETLVGRLIRRGGQEARVNEACLAVLGDPAAVADPAVAAALAATHGAWGGKPDRENRAAQILSLTCRDERFEPRVRAAFERYRNLPVRIPRVFDHGIPVVRELPVRHWVAFFLARTLGNLAMPASAPGLIKVLDESPTEAATGRPDPLGPGVLFLHNDLTPCWRAEVAWALGRMGDTRAEPVLWKIIADLDNATDTRHAAAVAAKRLASPAGKRQLAAMAVDYPEVSVKKVLQGQ